MVLTRYNSTRGEKVDNRTFRFVISDESKDRYGTVIKLNGWDLTNYEKNGIVAYQHNASGDNPDMIVGKGRAWVENGVLMGEVQFEPEGTNPIADKLVNKIDFGSIRATSVGFNPIEWSKGDRSIGEDGETLYFRKQDLLEWSIVNIPANPNAIVQNGYTDFLKMAFEEEQIIPIEDPAPPEQIETKPDEHTGRYLKLRLNTL